jgi:hypothetical protein
MRNTSDEEGELIANMVGLFMFPSLRTPFLKRIVELGERSTPNYTAFRDLTSLLSPSIATEEVPLWKTDVRSRYSGAGILA